jgi:hypothetical protein
MYMINEYYYSNICLFIANLLCWRLYNNTVTDLINALPGNSSVNTIQHATIEEAVFSVDPTSAPIDWLDSDHVICVYYDAYPFRGCISKSDRIRSRQLRKSSSRGRRTRTNKQAVSLRSTEEYKKSACEDLTCDLKDNYSSCKKICCQETDSEIFAKE